MGKTIKLLSLVTAMVLGIITPCAAWNQLKQPPVPGLRNGMNPPIAFSDKAFADKELMELPAPAVAIVVIKEKPLYKKALDMTVVRPARATWHGLKKLGHWIHVGNEKLKPTADVINTATILGGAYYFWRNNFGR